MARETFGTCASATPDRCCALMQDSCACSNASGRHPTAQRAFHAHLQYAASDMQFQTPLTAPFFSHEPPHTHARFAARQPRPSAREACTAISASSIASLVLACADQSRSTNRQSRTISLRRAANAYLKIVRPQNLAGMKKVDMLGCCADAFSTKTAFGQRNRATGRMAWTCAGACSQPRRASLLSTRIRIAQHPSSHQRLSWS